MGEGKEKKRTGPYGREEIEKGSWGFRLTWHWKHKWASRTRLRENKVDMHNVKREIKRAENGRGRGNWATVIGLVLLLILFSA